MHPRPLLIALTLALSATLAPGIVPRAAAETASGTTATATPTTPTDAQVQTRASALEVAGAFTNDDFIIRDGHWWSTVSPDTPAVIQVNLFAGNEYWFIAAAAENAGAISVTLYDGKGEPVPYQPYQNGTQAAAGFSPAISGPYYVQISSAEGAPATFCLVYTYK